MAVPYIVNAAEETGCDALLYIVTSIEVGRHQWGRGERTETDQTVNTRTSTTDPNADSTHPDTLPPLDVGAAQDIQDRKLVFVKAEADRPTVSPGGFVR